MNINSDITKKFRTKTAPYYLLIALCFALSGCNSSEAPHFLQSKEMQCLQSVAMSFKDPTSLKVVKNLGDRRGNVDPVEGKFWLFYAAKNGYGAYDTASMACGKTEKGWVRDTSLEWLEGVKIENNFLEKSADQLEHCNVLFKDKSTKSAAVECYRKTQTKYGDPKSPDSFFLTAQRIAREHVKSAKNLDSLEAYD